MKKQKSKQFGYALFINRTGEKGAANWERAGYCFNTKPEANKFKNKSYSNIKKFRIETIRLNIEPISVGFQGGKNETK